MYRPLWVCKMYFAFINLAKIIGLKYKRTDPFIQQMKKIDTRNRRNTIRAQTRRYKFSRYIAQMLPIWQVLSWICLQMCITHKRIYATVSVVIRKARYDILNRIASSVEKWIFCCCSFLYSNKSSFDHKQMWKFALQSIYICTKEYDIYSKFSRFVPFGRSFIFPREWPSLH
jgi:hypothetical protein